MTDKQFHKAIKEIIDNSYTYIPAHRLEKISSEPPTGLANKGYSIVIDDGDESAYETDVTTLTTFKVVFIGDARQDNYLNEMGNWKTIIKKVKDEIETATMATNWHKYTSDLHGDFIFINFEIMGEI